MKIESATMYVYDNSGEGVTLAEREIEIPAGEVTIEELKKHALAAAENAVTWESDLRGLTLRREPWVEDRAEEEKTVDISFGFADADWAEIEVSYCLEGCAALNAAASGEAEAETTSTDEWRIEYTRWEVPARDPYTGRLADVDDDDHIDRMIAAKTTQDADEVDTYTSREEAVAAFEARRGSLRRWTKPGAAGSLIYREDIRLVHVTADEETVEDQASAQRGEEAEIPEDLALKVMDAAGVVGLTPAEAEERDLLSINRGRDGKEYIWYLDTDGREACADLATGELIPVAKTEELFS